MRPTRICISRFALLLALALCGAAGSTTAQTTGAGRSARPNPSPAATPVVVLPKTTGPARVAGRSDLYCGGFIQYDQPLFPLEIVGAEQEQEHRIYSQGEVVYINAGAGQGMAVGQEYSVIRPRGKFRSKFSSKRGSLGEYTQEVGQLRIMTVKDRVSVASITYSCGTVLLGDLLLPLDQRTAPIVSSSANLDRFRDPSGKPTGRIVLAEDFREALAANEVVQIDLGIEDSVRPGDKLTIYRPVGKGDITRFPDVEVTVAASGGFESNTYRNGRFSTQAKRVKSPDSGPYGPAINTQEIRRDRPPLPRKIVGEMVILSVQQRTATAIITRTAQEVHTGDYVEVQ